VAHGGAREGAGRKRNVPNKASQKRQAEVARTGETPLAYMLWVMRPLAIPSAVTVISRSA
jgi:hypothetical protein